MKFIRKRKTAKTIAAYLFLLPNISGFLLFTFIPVFASLLLSFSDWDLLTPMRFVGLRNYVQLVYDPLFWKYLYNTIFLLLSLPFTMIGSLLLALVMNKKAKGIVVFRTIYFLPTISSGVALFLLWRNIYNPDFGMINLLLKQLKINGPQWLSSVTWVKPALILMNIWIGVGGYSMILYLAGLQGISKEYYDAAQIDGSSQWQQFIHITLPLLTPTTFFILTTGLISNFQSGFDAIYIMTGGGPAGASTTLTYYIWQNGFQWFKMGYAAALAWMLFLLVLCVTLLNWYYGGKRVQYF